METGALESRKRLVTVLCLLTKHYIHLCKCLESRKSKIGLTNYIKQTYRIECYIAQQKGTEYGTSRIGNGGEISEWLEKGYIGKWGNDKMDTNAEHL